MLKLIKTHFRRFLPLFLAAFALTVLRVVCELEVPNEMSDVVDTGIVNADIPFILQTGFVMLLWSAGAAAADILCSLAAARAAMGYGRDLRKSLYRKVTAFSLTELDELGTSSLITRTTNDIQQLERFMHMSMTMAMMSPIMLVGASIAAWNMNREISLVIFATIPVLLVVALTIMRFVLPLLRSLQRRMDKLNRITREGLTGIRVIRACCREAYEEQRFGEANRDLAETNVSVARRMSTMMPLITLILNLAVICIVWVGAGFVDADSFQVGDLMAVIQYAIQALMSAMMLSGVLMIWPRASAAAERVGEVLDRKVEIEDAADRVVLGEGAAARAHELRMEHVGFSYPQAAHPVLDDIDITLKAGKTYALIGATGSGKTTLINLIERFYEPSSGRILIDGVDIARMSQADLRSLISYVPQKTTLFSGTIAGNISYGNQGATREQIVAAAKMAMAHEFIEAKEDGYETKVTQAGGGLSGGQRQRIAIARALVKGAGLLIFDDSFSALDFKTDAAVRANLKAATGSATVLIVAQRVAVAMDADEVIVINDGRIDSVGAHEQLLQESQVYRDIVASQIEGEVE